jgi:uncharacterized protein (DUF2249 family)
LTNAPDTRPDALRDLAPDALVDVDVRAELMAGGEPFQRIMAAREGLSAGEVLRVRAIFDPVPLYGVMADLGMTAWTEELGPSDVRVWFWTPERPPRKRPRCDGGLGGHDGDERGVDALPGYHVDGGRARLDVRVIPPRDKHPSIFRLFHALAPGESFELVNDHDPKPLWYQFQAEQEGRFGWDYLEEGPEAWRVRISRT